MRNLHAEQQPVGIVSAGAIPGDYQIAAIQGASSGAIQLLLDDFALRARQQGLRIAGAVELAPGEAGGACGRRVVRVLSTGAIISISQNLGKDSTACNLDPSGLIDACAAVERDIEHGVDLVILSKFGTLEADRRGLSDAFRAAIGAGLPILTAVSPAMTAAWRKFAGPLFRFIPADGCVIDAWRSGVRTGMVLPTSD